MERARENGPLGFGCFCFSHFDLDLFFVLFFVLFLLFFRWVCSLSIGAVSIDVACDHGTSSHPPRRKEEYAIRRYLRAIGVEKAV